MRAPAVLAVAILLGCIPTQFAQATEGPAYFAPYSIQIVDENGISLPTYQRAGRTYVLGTLGQRYLLRVRNESGQRIEVVASVDGRDVLDGRPAGWSKRGYIVDPYGALTIDGYRLSQDAVAAFRFSSVPRSYAAQMGSARDVGLIGVAVFTERQPIRYWPYPLRRDGNVPVPQADKESSVEGGVPPSEHGNTPPAPAAPNSGIASRIPAPTERPGLGTEFGEEHASHVYTVHFERASSTPATVLAVRYDDRAGLLALGIDVDGGGWYSGQDTQFRETAQPFRRNASFSQPPPGWRR